MANNNTITIQGNLTRDPEIRYTQNGQPFTHITIASTPTRYNPQTRQYDNEPTLFLKATAWGQLAENTAETLQKGARVIAHGTLQQHEWEQDGQKRTIFELKLEDIGPSLRTQRAQITRNTPTQQPTPDPWTTQTASAPF